MAEVGTVRITLTGNIRPFAGAMSKAQGRLTALQRRMNAIKNTIQRVFQRAAVFAVIGFTFALGKAVQAAVEFEREMTKIETLVGVATERVADFADEVTAMAPEVAVAPNELADALFAVTSAGQRGSRAMNVLRKSAEAAAVGLGKTREIARTVVASMSAFSNQGLDTQEAVNTLVGTVREGNLVAEDLAGSLGRVIPIASAVGVSFQEVGSFIATFTRQGVSAREAVTALRSILKGALRPTNQQKEAMEELGMTVEDFNRRISVDFIGLLRDLASEFDTNREAVADLIGRVRGLAGFFGTAVTQGGDLEKILENINKISEREVTPGFETVQQTGSFAFSQLKASAGSLGEAIGDTLAPGIASVAEMLSTMAQDLESLNRAVSEAIPLFDDLSGGFIRFVAEAGIAITVLGAVAGAITKIKSVIAPLAALASEAAAAIGISGLAAAGSALAASFTGPGGVVLALTLAAGAALRFGPAVEDLITPLEGLERSATDAAGEVNETVEAVQSLHGVGGAEDFLRPTREELKKTAEEAAAVSAFDLTPSQLPEPVPEAFQTTVTHTRTAPDISRPTPPSILFAENELSRVRALGEALRRLGRSDVEIVRAQIDRLQSSTAEMVDWFSRAEGDVDGFSTATDLLRSRISRLQERLAPARAETESLVDVFQKVTGSAQAAFTEVEQLSGPTGLEALTARARQITGREAGAGFENLRARIGRLQQSVRTAREQLERDFDAIRQATGKILTPEEAEQLRTRLREQIAEKSDLTRALERVGTRAGESLIEGIILGANSMEDQLKRFLARLVSTVIMGRITSFLGIGSPAEALVPVGVSIGEGLAKGMEKSMGTVGSAADRMAAQAVPDISRSPGIPAIGRRRAMPTAVRSGVSRRPRASVGRVRSRRTSVPVGGGGGGGDSAGDRASAALLEAAEQMDREPVTPEAIAENNRYQRVWRRAAELAADDGHDPFGDSGRRG